jgi:glycerophosphoryl diester phosphodiesterase
MTRLLQILSLSCFVLIAAEPNRGLVHGHRGARAVRPENTIPAFEYAIKEGADAIELDLQVSKDGVLIVSHDPDLKPPICTGPQPEASIRQITAAKIREWDCGKTVNPLYPRQQTVPGTRPPTLDDVLSLSSRGNFLFNVEMKSYPEHPDYNPAPDAYAKLVAARIREHKLEKRVIVQSFDWRTLVSLRKIAPEIRLSALTEKDTRDFVSISKDAANAEIVAPRFDLVTPDKVAAAHAAGLQVVPWTPNTPDAWDKLIAAKVDAIITDDPAALIAHLKARR